MKNERPNGRASRLLRPVLRPVLLAGAATAVWLALSATAASAETGTDRDHPAHDLNPGISLPVFTPATTSASSTQATSPRSGGDSSGLLSPVLGRLTRPVDQIVPSLPVVPAVVPANEVTALAAPAVELADRTAAGAARTVIPVVSGVLPVAGPVLEPVADLLTGSTPLQAPPTALPTAPKAPLPVKPATDSVDPAPDRLAGVEAGTADLASSPVGATAATLTPGIGEQLAASPQQELRRPSSLGTSSGAQRPFDELPFGELPATVPAVPGSGAGSSQSASAPAAGDSAQNTDFELLPPPGLGESIEMLRHAPKPVSFEPGSSPD